MSRLGAAGWPGRDLPLQRASSRGKEEGTAKRYKLDKRAILAAISYAIAFVFFYVFHIRSVYFSWLDHYAYDPYFNALV